VFSRAITAPGCSGSSPALLQLLGYCRAVNFSAGFWRARRISDLPPMQSRKSPSILRRAASFNSEAASF
jgi:hypothetical protein